MNRYSNYTPSQFNPLSMEEIFTVPLAKQQKHDQSQAALDQLGLFDINRLDKDNSLAEQYINDYTGKIDEEINNINQSGINNQSVSRIKALARERDKWLKQGDGKHVQDNYNSYLANKSQLDKLYEKGDISADKYKLGLQQSLNNYKGVAEGDKYDPFNAVADTDYMEIARKTAKDISDNPVEIERLSGLQLTSDGSMYIDVKTGNEITPENAINLAVQNILRNDSNIVSDLKQRQELGLLGDRSYVDLINNVGSNMELLYGKNNRTIDRKLTGNKGYNNDDLNSKNQGLVYNDRDYSGVKPFEDKTLNKLSKVGKTITTQGSNFQALPGVGGGSIGQSNSKIGTLSNIGLNKEEESKFRDLSNRVFNDQSMMDRLGIKEASLDNPETIKAISNHIKNFQDNYVFTNRIIKSNAVDDDKNGIAFTSSKYQNASDATITQEVAAGGIKLYDQKTGEILDQDDINKFAKLSYSGYFSPDNLIDNLEGANEATKTSPLGITAYDEDGKIIGEFYGSRLSSDMESPQFQTSRFIKDITKNLADNLGVNTNIPLPPQLADAMTDFNVSFNSNTGGYDVSFIEKGNMVNQTNLSFRNRAEFNDFITNINYQAFGIPVKQKE